MKRSNGLDPDQDRCLAANSRIKIIADSAVAFLQL